jgi:hypothetical protein
MSGFQVQQTRHNNKPMSPGELPEPLQTARAVWVFKKGPLKPLEPLYSGPFQVLEKQREYFKIKMGDQVDTVSTSRLKVACMPPGAEHAQ